MSAAVEPKVTRTMKRKAAKENGDNAPYLLLANRAFNF